MAMHESNDILAYVERMRYMGLVPENLDVICPLYILHRYNGRISLFLSPNKNNSIEMHWSNMNTEHVWASDTSRTFNIKDLIAMSHDQFKAHIGGYLTALENMFNAAADVEVAQTTFKRVQAVFQALP